MVSIAASLIFILVSTALADGTDTCDASDPSKCISKAGTEEAEKGSALLQSVQMKGRATHVKEDLNYEEPRSQVEANFNEIEKHTEALASRLELLLENHDEGEEPLEKDHEDRVHHALSLLRQSQQELKTVRGKHASLIQNPASKDHDSQTALLESMTNIQNFAREAEEILSEVDGDEEEEDGDEEHPEEVLLQDEGEEDEDEDEEDEDEGREGEEDEEEDEEDHDEHDEKDEEEGDKEDVSLAQKGEGVQYEPEDEEKNIERH